MKLLRPALLSAAALTLNIPLAAQTAAWNTLKSGKLAELNKTLQAQNLPEIELSETK